LLSYVLIPELWTGRTNVFSTLSGFATFYGVLFAAIEVVRARSASEMAESAAASAQSAILSAIDIKTLAECKTYIRNSLVDLERDGWASTSALARVLELYTSQFYPLYDLNDSPQRLAAAELQSHAASASGPLSGRSLNRLKKTLTTMLIHVTAASGERLSGRNP
jgi:hypothetical protein